jgi:hypothetical protein
MSDNPNATEPVRPIETAEDGAKLIDHLSDTMDALLRIVEEETNLVRAGRVRDATALEPTKSGLARYYVADLERMKANAKFLQTRLPERLAAVRQQHADFAAMLQVNLTVLATAHAVSESIIRGVASEITAKSSPATYGRSGRTRSGAASAAPVAVSRTL